MEQPNATSTRDGVRIQSLTARIEDVVEQRANAIADGSHTAIATYTRQLNILHGELADLQAGPAEAGPEDISDLSDDELAERVAQDLLKLPSPLLDHVLALLHTGAGPGPFNRALRPGLELLTGGKS